MKYSLAWLERYVDLSGIDVADLMNRITLSVAELEGSTRFGEDSEALRVAAITEVLPHPNAQKLSVCRVDDGEGERTVVCGAPNVRAGMRTALAPPGSKIKGHKIGVAKLRGVESEGMLCSGAELDISDDHDGICDLPEDLTPGTPLLSVLPLRDTVFEVENKSLTHRPDLWGYVGMAREIAALVDRPLRLPPNEVTFGEEETPSLVVEAPEACPRYTALGFEIPGLGRSPLWLQLLLHRSGVRSINTVVDLTNFVMLEWGNPVHAFDARQLHGNQIIVRHARESERVETLDRVSRELSPADLLICDAERPVALAGIMGLANSEIVEDTTRVVLETACFQDEGVRRSSMRLKLRTDASARFEKSLDPDLPPTVARRFAHLLLETIPGSRVTTGLADVYAGRPPLPVIDLSVSYVNERLGTALEGDNMIRTLRSLEFTVEEPEQGQFRVGVPSFRATKDVSIAEDLVEEIGRMYGYDNIEPAHPEAHLPKPYRHPARTFHRRTRLALSFSEGFNEIQSYSFDSEPLMDRIGHGDAPRIRVLNPISSESTHMRAYMLPSVLGALERNRGSFESLRLYEIGRVFQRAEESIPDQPYRLALLLWRRDGQLWTRDQREALADLKSTLARLSHRWRVSLSFAKVEEPLPWLHPVRCAEVRLPDGTAAGQIGSLHPSVCEQLKVGPYAAAAELELDLIQAATPDLSSYEPVARFPQVPFDLSIIVPETVAHGEVVEAIRVAAPVHLQHTDYVDSFRGEPIPEGQKSLTYKLVFQSTEKTLEMDEVRVAVEGLMSVLGDRLGAWLRP